LDLTRGLGDCAAYRTHSNFMCKDSDEGAVVICVAREEAEAENGAPSQAAPRKKAGTKPLKKYRVLIRTPRVTTALRCVILISPFFLSKTANHANQPSRSTRRSCSALPVRRNCSSRCGRCTPSPTSARWC
jgi:hypothetical protein